MDKLKKQTKRVILFGIDGAGTFFEQAETPNIDRIFKEGAVSNRTLTELPSISAECWGSMLHGVDCTMHGLTNSIAGSVPYPSDSPYPSVFRVIREAMPDAKLASFCDWRSVNKGIIEEGLGVYKYNAKDYDLIEPAIEYINENDFTLLYFQFDSVDGKGHRFGYGSAEHLEMITVNDGYIGRIVDAVEKRGWLSDTLILVEADHGGTPNNGEGGSHGGSTDAEKYVCFYAAGSNVCKTHLTNMRVRDTSPAILHALGIRQPDGWTGHVPEGLFADGMDEIPKTEKSCDIPPRTADAPMEENGKYLTAFADLDPVLYLPMEADGPFPEGTKRHGKLYFVDGIRGQGIRLEDGYLSMPCPSLTDGFSLICWVRPDASLKRGIIAGIGASVRNEDPEPVFCLSVGSDTVLLEEKGISAKPACPVKAAVPVNTAGKWIFLALTVDITNRKLTVWVDFDRVSVWDLPRDMRLPKDAGLFIGWEEEADLSCRLAAVLDDFCICRKALDSADIKRFKEYYHR